MRRWSGRSVRWPRRRAYFADTPTSKIMTLALDAQGWPEGTPEVFVDLTSEGLNPDGAVTDSEGA
ncbi:SMP-30/gluconolactonase/LRE family protein, partial [Thioclava indica]|uniref:SMP-30/gluconolactonase/LRE family protein n=1 Tax=Thioclava indica TaxID=1353528 RepID=UPI0030B868BF